MPFSANHHRTLVIFGADFSSFSGKINLNFLNSQIGKLVKPSADKTRKKYNCVIHAFDGDLLAFSEKIKINYYVHMLTVNCLVSKINSVQHDQHGSMWITMFLTYIWTLMDNYFSG
jgi:hypothetical protein